MSSLQKPRKISIYGDDGATYAFLCKPKDDLRKDARLMEFNSMIIKLLKKDSESRNRQLCASPALLSAVLMLSSDSHVRRRAAQRGVRSDRMGSECRRPPHDPQQELRDSRYRRMGTCLLGRRLY